MGLIIWGSCRLKKILFFNLLYNKIVQFFWHTLQHALPNTLTYLLLFLQQLLLENLRDTRDILRQASHSTLHIQTTTTLPISIATPAVQRVARGERGVFVRIRWICAQTQEWQAPDINTPHLQRPATTNPRLYPSTTTTHPPPRSTLGAVKSLRPRCSRQTLPETMCTSKGSLDTTPKESSPNFVVTFWRAATWG